MPPNGGGCGGASTSGSVEAHSVELRLVMSSTTDCLFLTKFPLATKSSCCPIMIAVGAAEATNVETGVAVITGVLAPTMVRLGTGVGDDCGSGPSPITMVLRLNPGSAPGLGQRPATKSPNSS